MKDQEQLANQTTQRFEIEYMIDDMQRILSRPQNCFATLNGLKANGPLNIKGLTIVFKDFQRNEESKILVYQVFSHSQRLYAQKTLSINSYELVSVEGETTLNIQFNRDQDQQFNRQLTRAIALEAQFDESKNLIGCRAKSQSGASNAEWNIISDAQSKKWITPAFERRIQIGQGLSPSQLTIDGSLRATLHDESINCTSDNIGLFGYDKKTDRFLYCSNQGLKELNQIEQHQLQESTVIINTDNPNLTQQTFAKICTLNLIKTQSGLSKCQAAPSGATTINSFDLDFTETLWDLSLIPSSENERAECQFRCLK